MFEVVSDRLCYLIINVKISDIAIINCYATTKVVIYDYKDSFYYNHLDRVHET